MKSPAAAKAKYEYYIRKPWAKHLLGISQRLRLKPRYYSGIERHLTVDEIKQLWVRDDAGNMDRPCLHRIDSTGHYSFDNCGFMEVIKHNRLHTPFVKGNRCNRYG